jgi:hypothetical protein
MPSVAGAPVATRWRWLNWPGWLRLTAAAVYFATVNWLLLAPASTFDSIGLRFPYEDKVVHFGMFAGLALLARWSAPERFGLPGRRLAVAAALVVYACAIEALQPSLTHFDRQFEWLDMACNFTGVVAGWLLFGLVAARAALPSTTGRAVR